MNQGALFLGSTIMIGSPYVIIRDSPFVNDLTQEATQESGIRKDSTPQHKIGTNTAQQAPEEIHFRNKATSYF
jgi:hypothetical protein